MKEMNLYISGAKVDLSEDSLISFVYQVDDLQNPTIVRNTYSLSVNLPATPRNNAIFGAYGRNDRRISANSFNALKRADFRIVNERGEIVESGYVRLDATTRRRCAEGYTVTLFGGLGSFIYSLAYDAAGEKRTLASMRYLNTADADTELNFTITRQAVAEAWARLGNADGSSKWDVVNFAPCVNPSPSDFDTAKVVIDATNNGSQFPATVVDGGTTYHSRNGYLLAELGKEYTEAQMRDYRSYLQRPVVSVRAVLDALCRPENNGGYTVRLDSSWFNANNPYYNNTWMALDLLAKDDTAPNSQSVTVTYAPNTLSGEDMSVELTPSAAVPQGKTDALLHARLNINPGIDATLANPEADGMPETYILLQLVAYSGNNIAGAGDVICLAPSGARLNSTSFICQAVGFLPAYGAGYGQMIAGAFANGAFDNDIPLSCSGYGVTSWQIRFGVFAFHYENFNPVFNHDEPRVYDSNGDAVEFISMLSRNTSEHDTVTTEAFGNMRSGAAITKKMILGGGSSPAEFLLSFVKTFGLYIAADPVTKVVTVRSRNSQFTGETTDIDGRIDRDTEMEKTVCIAPSKWLELKHDVSEGDLAKAYKSRYGRDYGSQRINTGYEFDDTVTELLDGNIFKAAVETLEMSYLFADPKNANNTQKLNIEIDSCRLTYYDNSGNTVEREFGGVIPSSYTQWNPLVNFADLFPKVQMGDDAFGTLLFYGAKRYTQNTAAYITDDSAQMYALNDGKPCWFLQRGGAFATEVYAIPQFSRALRSNDLKSIGSQLEICTPKEIYNDYVTGIDKDKSIYPQGWKRFIEERYDANTSLVRCRVDLRGFGVGNALMRRFFMFDGSMWILNKIDGYTPNDDGLTICEFIRVNDPTAYTAGQSYAGYAPATEYHIAVNPRTLNIGHAGATKNLVISGDDSWTVAAPAWVTVSHQQGGSQGEETETTVTVTVASIATVSGREGAIVISGTAGQVITVPVIQDGVGYYTRSQSASLDFSGDGETKSAVIESNEEWTVECPEGFSASPSSGGAEDTATVTTVNITASSTEEERSGVIIIRSAHSQAQIAVTQGASAYTYDLVQPSAMAFTAGGGTQSASVVGRTYRNGVLVNSQVLTVADGLTLAKGSGDTNNQISINGLEISAANLAKNVRNALTVAVTASWRGVSASFNVTQAGNSRGLTDISINLDIDGNASSQINVNYGTQDLHVYGRVTKTYGWSSGATDYEYDVPVISKTEDTQSAWTLTQVSGEDYLAELTCGDNLTVVTRPCTITATYAGATSKSIQVIQAAWVNPYGVLDFDMAKVGTRQNYSQNLDIDPYEQQTIGEEIYFRVGTTNYLGFAATNNGSSPVELSGSAFSVKFAGSAFNNVLMYEGGEQKSKAQIAVGATAYLVVGAMDWRSLVGSQQGVQLQLWYDGQMMDNTVINVE